MPVAKFKHEGKFIDHTPGANIAQGTVVLLTGGTAGKLFTVAPTDLVANEKGSVCTTGVWEFDKLTTDVMTPGDKVYWDAGNSRMTLTVGANTLAGVCAEGAGNGVLRVLVRLDGTAV